MASATVPNPVTKDNPNGIKLSRYVEATDIFSDFYDSEVVEIMAVVNGHSKYAPHPRADKAGIKAAAHNVLMGLITQTLKGKLAAADIKELKLARERFKQLIAGGHTKADAMRQSGLDNLL